MKSKNPIEKESRKSTRRKKMQSVFLSNNIKLVIFFTCLLSSSSVHALDLGGFGGKKDNDAAPAQSLDGVINTQESIIKKYNAAKASITKAQVEFLEALDLKDHAAGLQDQQAAFSSGSVVSKDGLKKATKLSEKADKAIAESLAGEQELSEESKAKFVEGLVSYAQGVVDTKSMLEEFGPFLNSVKEQVDAAPVMEKMKVTKKLNSGMFVASKTPGILKDQLVTISKLVDFAKKKNIKVPKMPTDMI
jgi:hypothetical protein